MKKIVRNMSTAESRSFWASAEQTAFEIQEWPAWKRAGINVASLREEVNVEEVEVVEMAETMVETAHRASDAYQIAAAYLKLRSQRDDARKLIARVRHHMLTLDFNSASLERAIIGASILAEADGHCTPEAMAAMRQEFDDVTRLECDLSAARARIAKLEAERDAAVMQADIVVAHRQERDGWRDRALGAEAEREAMAEVEALARRLMLEAEREAHAGTPLEPVAIELAGLLAKLDEVRRGRG